MRDNFHASPNSVLDRLLPEIMHMRLSIGRSEILIRATSEESCRWRFVREPARLTVSFGA